MAGLVYGVAISLSYSLTSLTRTFFSSFPILVDVANCLTPPPYPSHRLPKGSPGAVQRAITLDTSKEKKILGIEFRTMEELARDTLADFGARGW